MLTTIQNILSLLLIKGYFYDSYVDIYIETDDEKLAKKINGKPYICGFDLKNNRIIGIFKGSLPDININWPVIDQRISYPAFNRETDNAFINPIYKLNIDESPDYINGTILDNVDPSLIILKRKMCPDICVTNYKMISIYNIGDYCIYRRKLYRCIKDKIEKMPFNESYWERVSLPRQALYLTIMSLPKKILDSYLYTSNIINPGIYSSLIKNGNTVINITDYYKLIEHYKSEEKMLKEFKRIFGKDVGIRLSVFKFYVLEFK